MRIISKEKKLVSLIFTILAAKIDLIDSKRW